MPRYHTVQQGEHLARIALQYGFPDYRVVWNDAGNASLRELRPSPDVLKPGDQVFIPESPAHEERRATNARHRFTVNVTRPTLRLALEDLLGKPLRSARGELRVDGQVLPIVADGHGVVHSSDPY